MKPNEIRAKLILRGIRLQDIASMCDTSKQQVYLAIRNNPRKGKQAEVIKKILEIIKG